jgi:hypothetical protein
MDRYIPYMKKTIGISISLRDIPAMVSSAECATICIAGIFPTFLGRIDSVSESSRIIAEIIPDMNVDQTADA